MFSKKLLHQTSKCFFSLLLVLGISYNAFAQQGIIVKAESGATTSISFQKVYKLNFVNETMTVVSAAGTSEQTFTLATTRGFSVGNVAVSGIKDQTSSHLRIYPTQTSETLFIDGATQGSKAAIYAITGAKVMDFTIQSANESILVNHLMNGLYLIRINGQAYKFYKQ